jgi:CRISPR-associated protein (TIGR02710 family)
MMSDQKTLLICTVGGSPEPIVVALRHWQPQRVLFVHTPQSKGDVHAKVLPQTRDAGFVVDDGRFDLFELPDGQDLESCLDRLRQLAPAVTNWVARGSDFRVVVDFTGGTKCMSAAIGIQASHWPCVFSYVGGDTRTKAGLGVVVSGSEKVVQQSNPWDALGHQAIEEFKVLFDQRAFLAAANLASKTMKKVSNRERKDELACLQNLANALDAWDRFDHKRSKHFLASVDRSVKSLRDVLGANDGNRVHEQVLRLVKHLEQIEKAPPPSEVYVLDLLANAKRRKDEGRYDDAVARLYRAIEAIAQVRLRQDHGFESTANVPLDRVPPPLQSSWQPKAKDGVLKLGLQDAYSLLAALGNRTGQTFRDNDLHNEEQSPLGARNRSILAHGFEQVSEAVFNKLWTAALALAGVEEASLPSFPQLTENGDHA